MHLKNYFKRAQKQAWAIGQFNIANLETLRAIVQAAKNLKSPILIGTSDGESKFLGLKQAAVLVETFRKETGLPIFLNLDHGKNFDYIKRAIGAGYNAVHFDGSTLPLKENIAMTKKVVAFARKKNVLVEGEVGVIGGELTDAEEAGRFIKETKVDSLAVNVGTFHGLKKNGKSPEINFQRLREIKDKTGDGSLVLHGGSGVPDSEIKKAIKTGIVKININTELRAAYANALKKALKEKPKEITPYKYLPAVILAVQEIVEKKIKLFGSVGKI